MTSHRPHPGLSDAGWTEQERALLSAARADRMPAQLEARLRDALQLQLGGAAASGAHGLAPSAQANTAPQPQLSGAAASGAHELAPSAHAGSAPQQDVLSLVVPEGLRAALARSARASQIFGSKLPLWGVLSIVALGTFVYLGLRGSAGSPQTAANITQSMPAAHAAPNAPAGPDQLASARDSVTHDGRSAADGRASSAAKSGPGESHVLAAVDHEDRSAADGRAGSAVNSGGDVLRALTAVEHDGRSDADGRATSADERGDLVARGEARALNAVDRDRRSGAPGRVGDAAKGGGSRAPRGSGKAAGVRASVAAIGGAQDIDGRASGVLARPALEAVGVTPVVGAGAAEGGGERVASAADEGAARAGEPVVDELKLEAELLDGARRALGRGALQQARGLLGRYSTRFARGVLRPERDVLGIELEMRTGARRSAQVHAERFLAEHPQHPLRERVRDLVAGAGTAAPLRR